MASEMESAHGGVSSSGSDSSDDDLFFSQRGCCHWMPFFGSDRSCGSGSIWWERIENSPDVREERWWCKGLRALKKVRGWSELVAGPKWKTFIRRFNKTRPGNGTRTGKFKYDPLSYALNFDDGPVQTGFADDDCGYRDFSSRYATIPILAKASMDLGRDAPAFT